MPVLFLAAAALAAPVAAPPPDLPNAPVTETMACPIGGASFSYTTTRFYKTHGERPDGKPYGTWRFPVALPECPDNGLVLYKEYTPEEVALLEPLVASEAFQTLRKEDTPYYRAYWLMKAMKVDPDRYLWVLLQASWEADDRPDLRKRYLAELAEASAAIPPRPDDLNWIGMEGRSINALRELGRFDEAMARLDKFPVKRLDVTVPDYNGENATPVADARSMRGWYAFFTGIRPVIERHDASIEPFDLLPRTVALGRCLDQGDKLDETGRSFCAKEATAVEQERESRDKLARDMEALRQSREASGR